MGTRLTTTEGKTALFDSTTGIAFGPVFESEPEGEAFLAWCNERDIDPRELGIQTQQLVEDWRALLTLDTDVLAALAAHPNLRLGTYAGHSSILVYEIVPTDDDPGELACPHPYTPAGLAQAVQCAEAATT